MKTIIWAVDPLLGFPLSAESGLRTFSKRSWSRRLHPTPYETAPNDNLQHLAAWALHRFVTRLSEPVRILPLTAWETEPVLPTLSSFPFQPSPSSGPSSLTHLSAEQWPEHWATLREDLRNVFAETTERVKIPGLEPLEMLENPSFPLRLRTELFYERCVELRADLIFVASRGQDVARRWLGGSFAEHLASGSAIPCLIMNPSWNRLTDYHSFHFASGFSETSLSAFESLLPWLRALRSKTRLLHFSSGALGSGTTEEPAQPAERFVQLARAHYVPVDLDLRTEPLHELVPLLIRESEETGGFIGLDAPAPSLRRVLRGNPVKRLIRSSHAPLFCVSGERLHAHVQHPEGAEPAPSAA